MENITEEQPVEGNWVWETLWGATLISSRAIKAFRKLREKVERKARKEKRRLHVPVKYRKKED